MTTIVQLNSLQRAVTFITNFHERGITVLLKADGSVTATLTPECTQKDGGVEWLAKYLQEEVRLGNFQDAMRAKGFGSIFLTTAHAESVMHIRVLPGAIIFHYVD